MAIYSVSKYQTKYLQNATFTTVKQLIDLLICLRANKAYSVCTTRSSLLELAGNNPVAPCEAILNDLNALRPAEIKIRSVLSADSAEYKHSPSD